MARQTRKIQETLSDDDVPEIVSHSASKADAKRAQKVMHDFETEEKARKKARNRERDQMLKERARVTRGKTGVRFADQALEGEDEDEGESGEEGAGYVDDVEARMLKAMRDAADEAESGGEGDDDDDDMFRGFGQDMELGDDAASGLDASSGQDDEDDDDAEMSLGEGDLIDPEAPTDDEEMEEDEEDDETIPLRAHNHTSSKKANYLADDLFAAAFASQDSKPTSKKNVESTRQETVKKRRRKSLARPKDLVIGGRTIRTLPRPTDPRSQATARSVPSARARRFVNQSLAITGKQAALKAKKKGWERRPANVGVMKHQGAPHGFVRNTR